MVLPPAAPAAMAAPKPQSVADCARALLQQRDMLLQQNVQLLRQNACILQVDDPARVPQRRRDTLLRQNVLLGRLIASTRRRWLVQKDAMRRLVLRLLRVLLARHAAARSVMNSVVMAAVAPHAGGEQPAAPASDGDLELEKALGGDHRDLAASYRNVASLHRDRGEHTEALPLFEKAYPAAGPPDAEQAAATPPTPEDGALWEMDVGWDTAGFVELCDP